MVDEHLSDSAARTRALARVVGPYLVVMAAALFVRHDTLALLLPAFMEDGPLVLATGAFTLMAGLAILALHHHWSSPPAIAISLIGAISTLKGAALMAAPHFGAPLAAFAASTPPMMLVAALLALLAGAWLTFVGWFSGTRA
ncbi:MAG: hypothetical protein AB7M12_06745 [Hyphomonadaceae bacterium]